MVQRHLLEEVQLMKSNMLIKSLSDVHCMFNQLHIISGSRLF